MAGVDIKVPSLGESVTEATVAKWFKQAGEAVNADEPLVELETDKVTVEVNGHTAGPDSAHRPSGAARAGRARGTRAHDAAAQAHRRAPQAGAEHRRDAHDVQRGGHERGARVARALQGFVREAPRREARLHVVL